MVCMSVPLIVIRNTEWYTFTIRFISTIKKLYESLQIRFCSYFNLTISTPINNTALNYYWLSPPRCKAVVTFTEVEDVSAARLTDTAFRLDIVERGLRLLELLQQQRSIP